MKRKFVSLIAALLALTMLAGCGKTPVSDPTDAAEVMGTDVVTELDAQGVYDKMSEAVAGRYATSFTSTTKMGAELTAAVIPMGAEVSAVTDIKLNEEPFVFYSGTNLSASLFGIDISESFQIYSQRDDAGLTNYFHIDSADKWLRQQLTLVPTDLLGQYAVTSCSGSWVPQNLTLTEQTDAGYVLTCTFSAEDVLHAISSPFGEINLEGVDLSGIRLETTYHVDGASFLPTQIEIAYSGIGEALGDLFNRYAGEMFSGFGANVNDEVSTYREVLSDLSYGPVEVPVVPEAGVQNSTDAADFNILESIQLA